MARVKKIINSIANLVPEVLEGLVLASQGDLRKIEGAEAVVRTAVPDGKVALLIGGGSGHEPMYTCYVGQGLADGSVAGNVFAAPNPGIILEATKALHRGNGVIYLYGNYAGDNMNFDIAGEMAEAEGITTATIRIADDIVTKDRKERRGIGGAFYVVKCAGAICAEATSLAAAAADICRVADAVRSIGVAVSAGSLPETGAPTFILGDDDIEIGMGAHGEPGVERRKLMPADELAEEMTRLLVADLPFKAGDEVALMINNLGATTMMELLIVNRKVRAVLDELGISVYRTDIGPFFTSQEMAGFSLSLMKLDGEIRRWLDAPTKSPGFSQ
ncbi:MAG: dihydroxyacetone kinase subunit DhaK [Alphaproteobacteria bacterium]|nr:dihydroxyacetone kinase subunit DhaK [Alphaproteobacteria bacterium]